MVPRWIHRWAVLTVCAALPLVVLGAEVTTKQVGMADPQSVRTPWHIFTVPMPELLQRGIGYVIEHSHRLAGWLVGACAIVLAIGTVAGARQSGVRWLGPLALVMVSAQGVLGILRVKLNVDAGPELAMFHGLFAQLVIATLVVAAMMTSQAWQRVPTRTVEGPPRRLAGILAALVYAQIFLGALVRHFQTPAAQRLHVLAAFGVVAIAVWLIGSLWERSRQDRTLRKALWCLIGLLALQLALGVEAWLGRFGSGMPVELTRSRPTLDFVRSTHYLVGAMLFSACVCVNLLLYRRAAVFGAASAAATSVHAQAMPQGGVA